MENLNELYHPEEYPDLTVGDAKQIDAQNAKNHWCLSYAECEQLIRNHEKARKENNKREMSKIEYLLTDINYHHECAMLRRGEYTQLLGELYGN